MTIPLVLKINKLDTVYYPAEDVTRFGCQPDDLKSIVPKARKKYPNKPICVGCDWSIIECDLSNYSDCRHQGSCSIYFERLIHDEQGRYPAGSDSWAVSSSIIEVYENCVFVTRNTLYIAVGDGKLKQRKFES